MITLTENQGERFALLMSLLNASLSFKAVQ